jgi:pimeloyl-ACP methyl ester carboxylesterase
VTRHRRLYVSLAVAAVVAFVASCTPPPTSGSTATLRLIDPYLVDQRLPSDPNNPQFSAVPTGAARGRLAVLFNGTGANPQSLARVGKELAADGFHVIGLRYESSLGTLDACPNSAVTTDPECHRKLRSEVTHGAGVGALPGEPGYDHPLVAVTSTTSAMNRLLTYVDYLASVRQEEGWEQYQRRNRNGDCVAVNTTYDSCDLAWTSVTVMGHSQGAGVALYLAKHRNMGRVAMLSGPYDAFGSTGTFTAAPWLSESFATSRSRMAAFVHVNDSNVARQRFVAASIGLTDAEVDVTLSPRPYGSSRRLATSVQTDCTNPLAGWAHNATVEGTCTPSGVHLQAWQYLATGS